MTTQRTRRHSYNNFQNNNKRNSHATLNTFIRIVSLDKYSHTVVCQYSIAKYEVSFLFYCWADDYFQISRRNLFHFYFVFFLTKSWDSFSAAWACNPLSLWELPNLMISQWEEKKKRKKGNKELKFILTRVQEGASLSSNTRCLTHAKQNETVQFPWMDEENKEEEENQIWWESSQKWFGDVCLASVWPRQSNHNR